MKVTLETIDAPVTSLKHHFISFSFLSKRAPIQCRKINILHITKPIVKPWPRFLSPQVNPTQPNPSPNKFKGPISPKGIGASTKILRANQSIHKEYLNHTLGLILSTPGLGYASQYVDINSNIHSYLTPFLPSYPPVTSKV